MVTPAARARSRAYNNADYRRAKREFRGLPCRWCGSPSDSVDHVIPLASGGSPLWHNLAPACSRCNLKHGGKTGGAITSSRRAARKAIWVNPRY